MNVPEPVRRWLTKPSEVVRRAVSKLPDGVRNWPTAVIAGALVILVIAGIGTWRLGWIDYWSGNADEPVAAPPEVTGPTPATPAVAAAASSRSLDAAAVRQALGSQVASKRFGKRLAVDVAPLAGKPVFRQGDWLSTPASTTKLVTNAGVLEVLGPDHTFTTSVTQQGNRLTLVGGGDPMLKRPDLRKLARDTAAALKEGGTTRVRLSYDDSLFGRPSVSPAWESSYVPEEVVAPITALMVEEGHDPGPDGEFQTLDDERVTQPSVVTTEMFAALLEREGINVRGTPGKGTSEGSDIATHEGPSVAAAVEYAIATSSNEVTEVLAHQAGKAANGKATFEGGTTAVENALDQLGIDASRTRLHDGSGLARSDKIAAPVLRKVLQLAASDDYPELAYLLTGLPVGGFTGTGIDRFYYEADDGRGRARLKSGTLTNVHSYAGIVDDANGTPMVVVLLADKVSDIGGLEARDALDDAAAALAACDCS